MPALFYSLAKPTKFSFSPDILIGTSFALVTVTDKIIVMKNISVPFLP